MVMCTCRSCGYSFYARTEKNLCDECAEKLDDTYSKIVAYLKKYPNSNAMQIADNLGIKAYDVLTFLDNGGLQKSPGTLEMLPDEPDLSLNQLNPPKN